MPALGMALVTLLLPLGHSQATLSSDVQLPLTLQLRAGSHFILYGEDIEGLLVFSYSDSSLYISGRRAFPPPPPILDQVPDSTLLEIYGGIPSVQRRLAEGASPQIACREFQTRQRRMIDRIRTDWTDLRAHLDDRMDSVPAESLMIVFRIIADSALSAMDPDVVGDLSLARHRASIDMQGNLRDLLPK